MESYDTEEARGETILLVDDESMVLDTLELLLAGRWPIARARSAAAAREVLAVQPVAAILADDRMPHESGIDFFGWAYRQHPGAVRILLTGYTDAERIIRAINSGRIWHFVRKPWVNEELINLLERALESRRASLAVQRSEQRYRDLFHHAHVGIARLDHAGRLIEANPAFAVCLGHGVADELLDRPLREVFADPPLWDHILGRLREERAVANVEVVLRDREGPPAFVLLSASLRASPGGAETIELCSLNLTEQEHARRESAELREQLRKVQRDQTVGSLAGGIAHDFANQLTVIRGGADYAEEQLTPEQSDVAECLADIKVAADNAAELSRQLLSFCREQPARHLALDANAILGRVLRLISRGLLQGIRLEQSLHEALPHALADAAELHHCFLNLCINACQAMEGGGVLRVETRPGSACADPAVPERFRSDAYVQVVVRDTGCGMSDDVQARIFEPFFTTRRGAAGGTGLGLSIVRGVVERHEGHIHVDSAPGKGSCFRVFLPASARPSEPAAVPERLLRAAESRATIVLAEDEPAVRKRASQALEQLGYRVRGAGNGAEAVDLVAAEDGVALVILDLIMPVMDGEEAFRRIRERRPELPVLFCTGHVVSEKLQAALKQPAVDLLRKPFGTAQLAAAVRRSLGE
ncbi:MAG: response regulator [Deltaproteobacteria bacterium]|nr:response regulator [Deltaproteobacteria bacterium]